MCTGHYARYGLRPTGLMSGPSGRSAEQPSEFAQDAMFSKFMIHVFNIHQRISGGCKHGLQHVIQIGGSVGADVHTSGPVMANGPVDFGTCCDDHGAFSTKASEATAEATSAFHGR